MSAPDTEITLGPDSETTSTSGIFEFEGFEEVSELPVFDFECSLDNAEFTSCTSPYEVSGLSAGAHVMLVRAKDLSGVVDPTPDSIPHRPIPSSWPVLRPITPVPM
jgi:hypothetical protein